MGSSGSKKGGRHSQQKIKSDFPAGKVMTVDEATKHVAHEVGTSEERASKIVELCTGADGNVSGADLNKLLKKIEKARNDLLPSFEETDKNNSGYVSVKEATEILRRKMRDLPEESIVKMVQRYDTNNDDKFDYNEFAYFSGCVLVRKELLEAKFNKLDTNKDGKLSMDLVTKTLCDDFIISERIARMFIEDFDDGDGKIDKGEFFNIMNSIVVVNK